MAMYYLIKKGKSEDVIVNNSLLVRILHTPKGYAVELYKNPEKANWEKDFITGTFATYKDLIRENIRRTNED